MHILSWLAVNGTAAIVEFPGVLYRGGAEQKIRKYLIDNNYVDTVIQLPPDLFFGTTIATCIIVLKKSKTDNAVALHRRLGRVRPRGNKNKLTAANQQRILDAFIARERRRPLRPARRQRRDRRERLQHRGHRPTSSRGHREAVDITALNAEIARIVARQAELRTADRRDRRRPRGARVSRIDDLIAELVPATVSSSSARRRRDALRRAHGKSKADFSGRTRGSSYMTSTSSALIARSQTIGVRRMTTSGHDGDEPSRLHQLAAKSDGVRRRSARATSAVCLNSFCLAVQPTQHGARSSPEFESSTSFRLRADSPCRSSDCRPRGAPSQRFRRSASRRSGFPCRRCEVSGRSCGISISSRSWKRSWRRSWRLERLAAQYAYYRDRLLSSADGDGSVAWHPMSSRTFSASNVVTKADVVPDGIASIHYGELHGYGVRRATAVEVRPDMATSLRFAMTGDVVIAGVWRDGRRRGKGGRTTGYAGRAFMTIAGTFRSAQPEVRVLLPPDAGASRGEERSTCNRAKVKRMLRGQALRRSEFRSRRRENRTRIVAILDKFDALVNDLSSACQPRLARSPQAVRVLPRQAADLRGGCGMSEAQPAVATSRSPSARRARSLPSSCPMPRRETAYQSRGRARARVHQAAAGRRRTSTCRSRREAQLVANLRTQLEALNEHHVHRRRVGAVLHRADRRRERRHRREDRPHPGGPRPAPEARRRHDQEHHADRQGEHPQQPAAGHQPVRDRPGRRRRSAPTATT